MIKISIIVHQINLAVLHVALCISVLCHSSLVSEASTCSSMNVYTLSSFTGE